MTRSMYTESLKSPCEAFQGSYRELRAYAPMQSHSYLELFLAEAGTMQLELNSGTRMLVPGELAVFHSGQPHAVTSESPQTCRFSVIRFDIGSLPSPLAGNTDFRMVLDNARRNPHMSVTFRPERLPSDLTNVIFRDCIRELQMKRYGYLQAVYFRIDALLLELVRIWQTEGLSLTRDDSQPLPASRITIQTITEYINQHSAEPLLVEDLAAMCGMSYSYFAKNFHQLYGRSCKEYIEFVRVNKVENLLLFTDSDLAAISRETGFADCSHLIKIFKAWKGITPKQYRLQQNAKACHSLHEPG